MKFFNKKSPHYEVNEPSVSLPVLQGLHLVGSINDLYTQLRVEQTYLNTGDADVEAIYVLPLPHHAVPLDLVVRRGDVSLRGAVVAATEATERYEKAIASGDSAYRVQRNNDDTCTVSVGNLRPGESVTVELSWAMLHRRIDRQIRLHLPLVIGPRYGSAARVGHAPEATPKTDLSVEYPVSVTLDLVDGMAQAAVSSASHTLTVKAGAISTGISLAGRNLADRPIAITLETDALPASRVLTWHGATPGSLVLYSPLLTQTASARDVLAVVDCSGSMAGDSMVQARMALTTLLDELPDGVHFNLIRFGDTAQADFHKMVKLDREHRELARRAVASLNADLGGTEIEAALELALAQCGPQTDILLITDGQVHVDQASLKRFTEHHRLFTVGVGTGVNETLVRTLADVSGGACELVSPNEEMAARIVLQCRRMMRHALRVTGLRQNEQSNTLIAASDTAFSQESWLGMLPFGLDSETVQLECLLGSEPFAEMLPVTQLDDTTTVQRLAAALQLNQLEDHEQRQQLALTNQLLCDETQWLIIESRTADDKADGNPEIVNVQQMMPAGSHGYGTVREGKRLGKLMLKTPMRHVNHCERLSVGERSDYLDSPTFLRRSVTDSTPNANDSLEQQRSLMLPALAIRMKDLPKQVTLDELVQLGVPNNLIEVARSVGQQQGWTEQEMVNALLGWLFDLDKPGVMRKMKRLIAMDWSRHYTISKQHIDLLRQGLRPTSTA